MLLQANCNAKRISKFPCKSNFTVVKFFSNSSWNFFHNSNIKLSYSAYRLVLSLVSDGSVFARLTYNKNEIEIKEKKILVRNDVIVSSSNIEIESVAESVNLFVDV